MLPYNDSLTSKGCHTMELYYGYCGLTNKLGGSTTLLLETMNLIGVVYHAQPSRGLHT